MFARCCTSRTAVAERCRRAILVQVCRLLWGGLTSLGLQPFVEDEADRLATVNTVKVARVLFGLLPNTI